MIAATSPGTADGLPRASKRAIREAIGRLTLAGVTQTAAQWARQTNINYHTLRNRIGNGWGIERALTTPADPKGGQFKPGSHAADSRFIRCFGKRQSLAAWAKETGVMRRVHRRGASTAAGPSASP